MSDGFPYADIVILALIAGFILLRLRNVLGQKTGNDNPQFFQKHKLSKEELKETVIQLNEKTIKLRPKDDNDPYLASIANPVLAQSLKDIKLKDPQFSATQFVDGAKMAFEMVFDAFAKGDTNTLRMLMADPVYNAFNKEIQAREKQDNKTETTLIAVTSKEIREAGLYGNMARITVKFLSDQVSVVRDPKGEIVEGDISETHEVENEWVFERDVTSKNPNWKIIET